MPFKSVAQQHFLYANKPELAKEFAKKTPKTAYNKLPKYVEKTNSNKELPAWKRRIKKIT